MFGLNLMQILLRIPGIIIGFVFHELGHAVVADRLGDPTPKNQGKLTLDPKAHIDPLGLLLIVLTGFGWTKPVETNPRYLRNPRRDSLMVSIAGPAANLAVAIVFAILFKVFLAFGLQAGIPNKILSSAYSLFQATIFLNIVLFVLNLLPIPPLDGFHVLADLMPPRYYRIIYFMQQYGLIIFIIFILTRASQYMIGIPSQIIYLLIARTIGIPL